MCAETCTINRRCPSLYLAELKRFTFVLSVENFKFVALIPAPATVFFQVCVARYFRAVTVPRGALVRIADGTTGWQLFLNWLAPGHRRGSKVPGCDAELPEPAECRPGNRYPWGDEQHESE